MKKMRSGFTLTELLIVIAIIGILVAIVAIFNWRKQIDRSYDAKRKSDLQSISVAFENYYNDHNCYPDAGILSDCGGTGLDPYLKKIPCDPVTQTPYVYVPNTDACTGYHACAALQNQEDPVIVDMGCNPVNGCGWGTGYNYCIAAGGSVTAPGFVAYPSPTATPTLVPSPTLNPVNHWACHRAPNDVCHYFVSPTNSGCPFSFPDSNCDSLNCKVTANQCLTD